MIQQNQQTDFSTSDIFLATSLFYYGIVLRDVELDGRHGVFIFHTPHDGLGKLVEFIRADKLTGNFRLWFSAYKAVQARLRDKKKEAGLWRNGDL